MENHILLSVENLTVRFPGFHHTMHAINGCSFDVRKGELLGLVGESGCGKSLTSAACMGILPANAEISGRIRLGETDMVTAGEAELASLRGQKIAMIFQNPMTALNPFFTVGRQLTDVIRRHQPLDKKSAYSKASALLNKVHLPDPDIALKKYPHQFSGGQLQRIMIAMALSCEPDVLIADEPTTALDVTIQAQIIVLLRELASTEGLSVIFITHDLSVVASLCDRVAVMYAGRVVEIATTEQLFAQPLHPYTQGLLQSVPEIGHGNAPLFAIKGSVPDLRQPLSGCAFVSRCQHCVPQCYEQAVNMSTIGQRQVRCFQAEGVLASFNREVANG